MTMFKRAIVVLGLLIAAGGAGGSRIAAQDPPAVEPGPRFLAAVAGTRPVDVAVRRTPILSQLIKLELDEASLGEALDQIGRQSGIAFVYSRDELPAVPRITLSAARISVAAALRAILAGSEVDVVVKPRRQLVLVTREPVRRAAVAVVTGRVTDSATGAALGSATVTVEGTRLGALTGADGRYRIEAVPVGRQVLLFRRIGYGRARRSVTVVEGQETSVDAALGAVATPLEEMVVTGTAFEAQVRTIPNPISVVTAKQIEEKGSTSLTELLRGEIPGLTALDLGQNDYGGGIYVRGNASWATGDVLKIYIDGVHVSDPTFLTTINPKAIDRIEIVRGPQAAAIYGAEAASGVMQVFTKKGESGLDRPRIDVQASVGAMESRYKPSDVGTPVNQDHSVGVSGGGSSYSYRIGASYSTIGEWLPRYGSRTVGLSGGLRVVQGPFSADLTLLWSERNLDPATSPMYRLYPASPLCRFCGQPDLRYPNYEYGLSESTMGLTLGYRASDRWRHTLTLGQDENAFAWDQPRPHLLAPSDTFVMLSNRESRRRSVRYHTAYDARLGSAVTARFTAGVDYWSYDLDATTAQNLRMVSGVVQPSALTTTTFTNDSWWNAGYLAMAEVGFSERLYLTLASRLEQNPHFGQAYGTAFAPRVGAAYTLGSSGTQLKLRAQWGKGVRPPPAIARAGGVEQTGGLGLPAAVYLPNPDIGPEERAGWDGGFDLYFGSRASLSVTRYREIGRNLVQYVTLDPAAVPQTRQYRNIGKVRSAGWELEGELNAGPVTLNANYSYSDNKILALGDQYTADPNSIYKVGDRMEFIPKHSGGATATVRVLRGNVSLNTSVVDEWRALDNIAFFGFLYGGEPFRGSLRGYFTTYSDALWKWNFRLQQEVLRDRMTVFVRVNNLSNNQRADTFNFNVTPGRTTIVGVRWTY
jgi:iron complex outermembrane receptor protein